MMHGDEPRWGSGFPRTLGRSERHKGGSGGEIVKRTPPYLIESLRYNNAL